MMWLWDSPLLTFFTVVAIAAFCFWYYLLKPFLRGQLSPPLGRAIGRLVHYPKLPFIMGTFYFGLRPCPYWTPIDDFVYLGGLPLAWHEDELKKHKIKAVVNMCDEDCGPITLYLKLGIEQLWLPTVDHTEPTLDSIKNAIKFISYHTGLKHNVLIHCMIGRGRSAAVAFCWLAHRHRDKSLEQLQTMLLERRPLVRKKLSHQRVVKEFYRACIENAGSTTTSSSTSWGTDEDEDLDTEQKKVNNKKEGLASID